MKHSAVIQVSGLTKRYKDVLAVNNVDMTVHSGDIYGVLGPNGAGKTTIISMILGLVHANHGTIHVLGGKVSPNQNSALKKVGALIGARPAYFPYLTARQNVAYIAHMFGVKSNRVEEVLEFMGIADAADRMPHLFSTGMKQRLGIAMAIVHNPKVLILDEPTNGMDPTGMREMRLLIKNLAHRGITILLCSHLLNEVEQICNRVAVFSKGSIVAEGTIQQLQDSNNTVCIQTQHRDKTIAFLQNQYSVTPSVDEQKHIEVQGIESEILIQQLVTHHLPPQQVYIKRNSLEDMFLQLVENDS